MPIARLLQASAIFDIPASRNYLKFIHLMRKMLKVKGLSDLCKGSLIFLLSAFGASL